MQKTWTDFYSIFIPILESWSFVIDIVGKYRLRSKDRTDEKVGTNDKGIL